MQVIPALAAVLLGVLQPEEADSRQLVEHLVREPALVLPLLGVGPQLVGHEPPYGLPKLLVLLAERRERPPGRDRGDSLLEAAVGERGHSRTV